MSTKETAAEHKASTKAAAAASVLSKADVARELDAIRSRLAERRKNLAGGGTTIHYNTTDLADAEWLMCELDHAIGGGDAMTPSERHELAEIEKLRLLSPAHQAVMNRISAKHGDLTPEELVEKDYLTMCQDGQMGSSLERYKVLLAKAESFHAKMGDLA